MAIVDIFSKRQKRSRGEIPSVLTFDRIEETLRVQVLHIIRDAFGTSTYEDTVERAYQEVIDLLCREYGVFTLVPTSRHMMPSEHLFRHFLEERDVEKVLDVVEICFRYIDRVIRDNYEYSVRTQRKISPDNAIAELNARLREHGVGYTFETGTIIKLDSTYVHAEITVPALQILHDGKYRGAMDEFLKAHEHWRHGRNKEAINDSLKAFESVLKTICERKKWAFQPTDTAKKLIDTCLANGLVPSLLESELNSLRTILESGLPTIRNRLGAHGQGAVEKHVDENLTKYCLDLTASNIRLFAEAAR